MMRRAQGRGGRGEGRGKRGARSEKANPMWMDASRETANSRQRRTIEGVAETGRRDRECWRHSEGFVLRSSMLKVYLRWPGYLCEIWPSAPINLVASKSFAGNELVSHV
jgi:hypothetical protein